MPYRSADGRTDDVAVLTLKPDTVAEEFEARKWPAQQRLTVYDRDGALVLRIPRQQQGIIRDKEVFAQARDARAGTFPGQVRLLSNTNPGTKKSSVSFRSRIPPTVSSLRSGSIAISP